MQVLHSGRKEEKGKKTSSQPHETILLRYPEPKYKFQGKKIPKEKSALKNSSQGSISMDNLSSTRTLQNQNILGKPNLSAVSPLGNESMQQAISLPVSSLSPKAVLSVQPSILSVSQLPESKDSLGNPAPCTLSSVVSSANIISGARPLISESQIFMPISSSKPVSVVDPRRSYTDRSNWQQNGGMPCSSDSVNSKNVDELQQKLDRSLAEKESLKNQLDVQLEVNRDLKKLLVASMGEELQSRVEKLARERAELSLELGGFSKKVSEDYENLDKISIEADMWRSKYLASKVMVDELASSKAFVALHFQESQEALQQMLNERHELRANLMETYKCLQQVKAAFDPLNTHKSAASNPSTNVLNLAKKNQQLSETIRFRLLPGHICLQNVMAVDDNWNDNMTPAEIYANELLSRKVDLDSSFSSLPSSRGCSRIERYHPQVKYDNLTINCCHHCKGDISLV